MATKIVMSLMENLLNKGHRLFIDNWYTSVELCHNLLLNKTDSIGTLRKDQKELPTDINLSKIKAGETIIRYEKETGLMCTRWKDKRDVYMMSSCIENDTSAELELANQRQSH